MNHKVCKIYAPICSNRLRKDLSAIESLDYCYPILDRVQELDSFDNILDEIGVTGRNYSGILIEVRFEFFENQMYISVCNSQSKSLKVYANIISIITITIINHFNL